MPIARALFVVKYVATIATLGRKRHPSPSRTQTPCAKNNCQYSLATLVIIRPNVVNKVPVKINALKYPLSKMGPTTILSATSRKA